MAALAATSAFAQSTVTIYGQADAAYTSARNSAGETRKGIYGAGRGSNFIGFMGSEDLGGGLKANFKIEAGYSLDSGVGAASNTNNQATGGVTTQSGPSTAPVINSSASAPNTQDRASIGGGQGLVFNRYSYAGLSGNFGEVRVGRDYTSTFNAVLGADMIGANGVQNTTNMTLALAANQSPSIATSANASNMIGYETPSFNGFRAKAQVFFGENASTGTNAKLTPPKAGDGSSAHVFYAQGPLTAGTAKMTTKGTAVASATGTTGLPGQYEQSASYAKYNLGVAVVSAGQVNEELSGNGGGTTDKYKNTTNLIGVSVPMGAVTLNGNYLTSKLSKNGTKTSEGNQVSLQALYSLSKRTDLYANYARVTNKQGTGLSNYYTIGAGTGAIVAASNSSTGYQVGLRHNF